MPNPKLSLSKRRRKRGKVKVRENVELRRKSESGGKSYPKMPAQAPRDNGVSFKIKIKRK